MVEQLSPGATHGRLTDRTDDDAVIGMDIGGTNLRVALADMQGTVLARWSASTAGMRSAQLVVDLICEGVAKLLNETSRPRNCLRAVAAGAPGVTDVDAGIVIATSYLMGWNNVPLRTLLESAIGVPAAVDNDVNLAALGESWLGAAKGTRDFVFLGIGTGVGAGIVLNGQVFRGMGWRAGEIGYMLVPGVSEEPATRGEPGALESMVGGDGVRAQWRALCSVGKDASLRDLTATEIFDLSGDGNPLARDILYRSARTLAYAIHNMSLVLSCPLFVLGGSVGMHPALCLATQSILQERGMRVRPQLTRSTLGAEAQLIGSIRLALDTATAHRDSLVG